jgi:long-subunit acyl-CoA synthetase (AMP-forming)
MRTPSSLTNELDRELMNRASTLQSVLHSLGEHGEKIALLAITKRDQQRWSYRKLGNSARSFANGLIKAGFKSGDSIALFSETGRNGSRRHWG